MRFVYEELVKERDFKHAHFYIKSTAKNEGFKKLQTQLIKNILTKTWKDFGTIEYRDNDKTLNASSYYYKETDSTFNYICSTITPQ